MKKRLADTEKPAKGARIVVAYAIPGGSTICPLRVAVRKRLRAEEYEAVQGYEDLYAPTSTFRWTTLYGVYPTALEAKDALAEAFPGRLRPIAR